MTIDLRAFKVGLLIVVTSWFVFTLCEFIGGLTNYSSSMRWYIALTEVLGSVGLGFRTAASFIAVVAVSSFFFLKNIGKLEAIMAAKLVLLLEAFYFAVTFIPSAIWGVGPNPFVNFEFTVSNFIPCMVEGVLIPVALVVLYVKMNLTKPKTGVVRWALIAGTAYIVAFWVTNACNWIYTVMYKGLDYLSPLLNILSFTFTVFGMLGLAVYAAYFTKSARNVNSWRQLDLSKIGAVTTLLGLYYAGVYLLWIIAGNVGGWSAWYAWFLGHNVDLWVMILPAVGLPLLFYIMPQNTGSSAEANA
jgi:hypothetical protein